MEKNDDNPLATAVNRAAGADPQGGARSAQGGRLPPSRQGKKGVVLHVDPEIAKRLKILAAEHDIPGGRPGDGQYGRLEPRSGRSAPKRSGCCSSVTTPAARLMSSRSVPYAQAASGGRARAEVVALLRRFGCESVGFMDDFADQSLMLAFQWRGRRVQLRASAKGWAAMYLRENPWHNRRRTRKEEWERRATEQGMVAVNSILRDWIKGQVTAVEAGLVEFDHLFLPYMLTDNGQTVSERISRDTLVDRGSAPDREGPLTRGCAAAPIRAEGSTRRASHRRPQRRE